MRSLLPQLYVPAQGLVLDAQAEQATTLVLSRLTADGSQELQRFQFEAGSAIKLPRGGLKPGETYQIDIRRGERTEQIKWQMLADAELSDMDERMKEILGVGLDESQRLVVEAVLFEQKRLNVNRELALRNIRTPL